MDEAHSPFRLFRFTSFSLYPFLELCFINRLTNKMYNLKNEAIMYIDNDEFGGWMQKLYAKLEELCKDVRVLRNADRVLPGFRFITSSCFWWQSLILMLNNHSKPLDKSTK